MSATIKQEAATRCLLFCSGEKRHEPLELPANVDAELFHLGRSRETLIKDTYCARNQGRL